MIGRKSGHRSLPTASLSNRKGRESACLRMSLDDAKAKCEALRNETMTSLVPTATCNKPLILLIGPSADTGHAYD